MSRSSADKREVQGREKETERRGQEDDTDQVATIQTQVNSGDVAAWQRQSGSRVELFVVVDTVADAQQKCEIKRRHGTLY